MHDEENEQGHVSGGREQGRAGSKLFCASHDMGQHSASASCLYKDAHTDVDNMVREKVGRYGVYVISVLLGNQVRLPKD